ncbi:unnamed protein product [Microthlaspi erraticum]|uniref:Mediator complex subunit 15 KIX domain-containing protein n=1 Tax=Microthlaspi erraticum TaxID=1685480 RepID=A0A6D2IGF0_9BRAS|nr:unnamed protein product [Microthlaspi erraticum]
MDTGDWRTQLPHDSREKLVDKIMETLKKHLPYSGPEGLNEHRRIAARFEEKIFSGAVNQTDYLRKISIKMLTMQHKSETAAGPASTSSTIPANSQGTGNDNSSVSVIPKAEPGENTGDWRTDLPPDPPAQ